MSAKRDLSFQLGIGTSPSALIEDPELAAELLKIYNAVNLLAYKLDEYTGSISAPVGDRPYLKPVNANRAAGVNRLYAEATVDLVAGAIVAYNSSGKLVKSTPALGAQGVVLENTSTGNFAPIAVNAVLNYYTGLIAGNYYYVSPSVPGGITNVAPVAGSRRLVGFAVDTFTLAFYPDKVLT